MLITEELLEIVCPEHSRTSCSDSNLSNYYDSKTGNKDVRWPRYNRCYLMHNLGEDTEDLEFKVSFSVDLEWRDR